MRRMGTEAASSTAGMVNEQRKVLQKLQVQLGDVNHAYSKTTAQALESHRREMRAIEEQTAALRRQENEVREAAALQARESRQLRNQDKITAEQYRRAADSRMQLERKQIGAIREQKAALEGLAAQSRRTYNQQIEEARRLHIAQVEQIRQSRIAAQAQLNQHRESLSQMNEEQNAMRARGDALRSMGSAAIASGVGMTLMGVIGVRALGSLVQANFAYATASRRTLTQVDKTHASLQRVEDIGKEIGQKIPVDFAQIQPALYDIFSSIDVGYSGARKLLKQFSKDAVGGQTDVETATKANLAIMNAYGISVRKAGSVSDFMFQLVRKGVGTYADFAKSIGLILPSAARLGVTLHQVGGTLAFMTRNGLSASRAATSGARAFDALSNPKTADNLKKLGVQILNTHGDLKTLPVILDLMMKKMKGMNNFEKSEFLKNAFYGSGGTIQALRFFNLVFKHMDKFHKYVGDMTKDSGTAKKAFETMAKGPQAQIQQLTNHWQLLRIELGHDLLPVALKLVKIAESLINTWNSLDPSVRRNIVTVAALTTAFLVLAGVIVTVMGGIAIFVGATKTLNVTAATAASKLGMVAGGLTAMAYGMYTAYTATDKTHKALGILTSALGGATAGAAFGPWGAAIGGFVGALGGLVAALHNSKDAAKTYNADYSKIIDTMDQLTGATTAATRAAVLDQLQRSGTLKNLQAYGISTRTAVSAILGEADARKVVTAAIHGQQEHYQLLEGQINRLKAANARANRGLSGSRAGGVDAATRERNRQIAQLQEQADAEKKVIDAVKTGIPDVRRAVKEARDRAFAVQDLTGKLNALPREKRTRITADGVYPTIKGIATVAKQYNLTPKQIRTVISAVGVQTTVNQVKKVEKGLKQVKEVKGDITPYIAGIRAGGHTVAALSREISQDTLKNLEDGPHKAKADLTPFIASIRNGTAKAKDAASTGGAGVGAALKSGVEGGLSGMLSSLSNTMVGAVNGAIAAARKAAKAHSPSKKTYELGKDMADGLNLGFKETMAKHDKDYTRGIHAWIASTTKKNIVPRYKETLKDLDKAQQKLKAILDKQKQWKQNVRSSIKEFGSLSSITAPTDPFGNEGKLTGNVIRKGLRASLRTVRKYGRLLKRLLKAGYSQNIYSQVAQMGPEEGVPYAQALLQESPKQIRHINRMNANINNSANRIANQTAKQMYHAGVKAAQGLVDGLQSKKKALERVARSLGKAIVKELKKILGIHSPSKAAMELGFNFGDTFAKSLAGRAGSVNKAASLLAQTAIEAMDDNSNRPGGGRGGPRIPRGGGGGRPQTVHHHHNHWDIKAGGHDPIALGRKMAWTYEKRFKKV